MQENQAVSINATDLRSYSREEAQFEESLIAEESDDSQSESHSENQVTVQGEFALPVELDDDLFLGCLKEEFEKEGLDVNQYLERMQKTKPSKRWGKVKKLLSSLQFLQLSSFNLLYSDPSNPQRTYKLTSKRGLLMGSLILVVIASVFFLTITEIGTTKNETYHGYHQPYNCFHYLNGTKVDAEDHSPILLKPQIEGVPASFLKLQLTFQVSGNPADLCDQSQVDWPSSAIFHLGPSSNYSELEFVDCHPQASSVQVLFAFNSSFCATKPIGQFSKDSSQFNVVPPKLIVDRATDDIANFWWYHYAENLTEPSRDYANITIHNQSFSLTKPNRVHQLLFRPTFLWVIRDNLRTTDLYCGMLALFNKDRVRAKNNCMTLYYFHHIEYFKYPNETDGSFALQINSTPYMNKYDRFLYTAINATATLLGTISGLIALLLFLTRNILFTSYSEKMAQRLMYRKSINAIVADERQRQLPSKRASIRTQKAFSTNTCMLILTFNVFLVFFLLLFTVFIVWKVKSFENSTIIILMGSIWIITNLVFVVVLQKNKKALSRIFMLFICRACISKKKAEAIREDLAIERESKKKEYMVYKMSKRFSKLTSYEELYYRSEEVEQLKAENLDLKRQVQDCREEIQELRQIVMTALKR